MVWPTQHILDAYRIPWIVVCVSVPFDEAVKLNTPWLQALGEAEAQLELINKKTTIDAVMMDDSDVFVFGVHTVLQKWVFYLFPTLFADLSHSSSLTESTTIKIYTAITIKCQVTPHLNAEGFAVMALCCGGDYDEVQHVTSLAVCSTLMLVAIRVCRGVALPLHLALCSVVLAMSYEMWLRVQMAQSLRLRCLMNGKGCLSTFDLWSIKYNWVTLFLSCCFNLIFVSTIAYNPTLP